MKTRRSLLAALGILLVVSGSNVMAADAEQSKQDIVQETNVLAETMSTEATPKVQNLSWDIDEKTSKWTLKIDGQIAKDGSYQFADKIYYIKDGVLVTGSFKVIADESLDQGHYAIKETGEYYFNETGENPNEGFGNLQKGNIWVHASDGRWLFVDEKGMIDHAIIGLQEINGNTYLLDEQGMPLKGIRTAGNKTYYFDETTGEKQNYTGWKAVDGKLYFFNGAGEVVESQEDGWKEIDGEKYYLEQGKVHMGWLEDGQKFYYLDLTDGHMMTGWNHISGSWYYFNPETGVMATSWTEISGKTYFFAENGILQGGWYHDGSHWYYLDPMTGEMHTGWTDIYGTRYYLSADGILQGGWLFLDGSWYYLNPTTGAMYTGWANVGGTWYYLNPATGAMHTGWNFIDGSWYYLNPSSGAMHVGWLFLDGNWYFMNGNGSLHGGWLFDNGSWYYMDPTNGAMHRSWLNLEGTWYCLNEVTGAMHTGWTQVGYQWYYMYSNGAMAADTWIDHRYVDVSGKWLPNYVETTEGGHWRFESDGWYFYRADGGYLKGCMKEIEGEKYLFENDGRMVTGWGYYNGYKYYFNSSGHMMQDLDSVIGRQSSYEISLNRAKCQVTIYAKDGANGYIIPAKTLTCSVGMPNTPTPTGTFRLGQKYRWKMLMGPSYGQYSIRFTDGIYFHSVAGSNMTSYNLDAGQYNLLGSPASHGCVRLNVRDAKWLYDNVPSGTIVRVSDNEPTPFDKPATIKIPAGQNWDPTDPAI